MEKRCFCPNSGPNEVTPNPDVPSKTPTEIDDYLFAKYNISDEIRKHIEDLLPDYYNIRKGQD